MIDFYYVDPDFIDYLQKFETESRGFTRVPNIRYDSNQNQKFVVGTVFQIGNYKYYAPISSYKKQKPNNILINIQSDKINPIKGSIRLNYMFPILDKYLTKVIINDIKDEKMKRLMLKEFAFCIANETNIIQKAIKTYLDVFLNTDPELTNNSCDFKLLESALNNPPTLDRTEDSDKGRTLV